MSYSSITTPSKSLPTKYIFAYLSHGFSSVCLCPKLIFLLFLSISKTITSKLASTLVNSAGCLIFLCQERSEICTSPSTPSSNSTKIPKLVKLRTFTVNLDVIQELVDNKKVKDELDFNSIVELRLARKNELVKILGRGELKAKIKVTAHKFTASAKSAIEAAGGEAVTL